MGFIDCFIGTEKLGKYIKHTSWGNEQGIKN